MKLIPHLVTSLLCLLFIMSCRPDSPKVVVDKLDAVESNKELDELPKNKSVNLSDEDKDWRDTIAVDYKTTQIKNQVAITEKVDLKAETKALVNQSFNAGKSCEEILAAYKLFIEKASTNLTAESIAELGNWTKDPLYNDCYSRDKSFRDKADQLDELLE